MFKKSLLILSFLVCFSAKAQNNIHTILHEADVYYSLDEKADELKTRIYDLIYENHIEVFQDSNLNTQLKNEERIRSTSLYEDIQVSFKDLDNTYKLKDSTILISIKDLGFYKIIFSKKSIAIHIDSNKHFYISKAKTLKLLNKDDKLLVSCIEDFLGGILSFENMKNFSKIYLKKLTLSIYDMGMNGNISAYKSNEIIEKYNLSEMQNVGGYKEYKEILIPNNEAKINFIDTFIFHKFNKENLKGLKIYMEQESIFEFKIITICPLFCPVVSAVEITLQPLFYAKSNEVISSKSESERFLIKSILNFNLKRNIDKDYDYIEDYERFIKL